MKRRLLATILAAVLITGTSALALKPEDISGGVLSGVAADGDALLITDTYNKVIWRVEGDTVTRAAGKIGTSGVRGEPVGSYFDGTVDEAMFLEPWAIAPYLDGYAISDAEANVIRYLDGETVRTAAGSGKAGSANGSGMKVSFDRPTGLAAGPSGELYIADTGNGLIRCMDTKGNVTTWATGLVEPTGLCWANGALYVAETGRSRICRVVNGVVTPISGGGEPDSNGVYPGGYVDGPVKNARFEYPQGVAVGADGAIYVADTGNGAVRKIANGRVTTLAAMRQTPEAPVEPRGLLLRDDVLLVTDCFAQTILEISIVSENYSDVAESDWYYKVVMEATARGLSTGIGEGRFAPKLSVTRAMFVTMLSRVHQGTDGGVVIDGEKTFPDLPENTWYTEAGRWAADAGIVLGSGGQFQGERAISLEEMVTILYRYAEVFGHDTTARKDLSGFTDADQISGYARDAVSWAAANDIICGNGDGALAPRSTASRAQMVKILVYFMDVVGI